MPFHWFRSVSTSTQSFSAAEREDLLQQIEDYKARVEALELHIAQQHTLFNRLRTALLAAHSDAKAATANAWAANELASAMGVNENKRRYPEPVRL